MSDSKAYRQEEASDLEYFANSIDYCETHDLGDELDAMPEARFEIKLRPRRAVYPLDADLTETLRAAARVRGVTAEALLNQWVREKATETQAVGTAE
jgi:hypothetical protein